MRDAPVSGRHLCAASLNWHKDFDLERGRTPQTNFAYPLDSFRGHIWKVPWGEPTRGAYSDPEWCFSSILSTVRFKPIFEAGCGQRTVLIRQRYPPTLFGRVFWSTFGKNPAPGGSQPPIAPPAWIRTERGLFRGISHVSVHHGREGTSQIGRGKTRFRKSIVSHG